MTETNAERLEQIKRHWSSDIQEEWECVDGTEITWLIEQAERVSELERNIELLEGQKGIKTELNNAAVRIIEEKEQENKQLLEAIGGFVKAVEIYSGKPIDIAMEELIDYAKEVEKDE